MNRKTAGAIFGVMVVAAVVTAGVVVASRPDRIHYIAAGDSLAVGEGATVEGQFYAGLFDQFYKKDHRGSERYTNVAVPGENSTDFGGDQLEAVVMAIDQEDSEVDVVTLTIGANDFLPLLRAEPCVSDRVRSSRTGVSGGRRRRAGWLRRQLPVDSHLAYRRPVVGPGCGADHRDHSLQSTRRHG